VAISHKLHVPKQFERVLEKLKIQEQTPQKTGAKKSHGTLAILMKIR